MKKPMKSQNWNAEIHIKIHSCKSGRETAGIGGEKWILMKGLVVECWTPEAQS